MSTTIDDLEAAMRVAKAQGKSTIPIHLFKLAELLAKFREVAEISNFEKDAAAYKRGR